ncbi:MAG TPA: bifunctional 4-hydroxy-3-methylbut-2-enyl diphosphate reductase/30S ribosomal protein S1 [Clostridiales bacterium]|nr:bifunctional 4-hydroxy-3-methylbut-2-enyl diphosphate reductase/30S ribosomal protein S1 [Clostridiales bacterium]
MPVIRVAENAGFCFGVKRAMKAVNDVIGTYKHIFTIGELIHNRKVVADLAEKGVLVVEDIDSIEPGDDTLVVIRSHGVSRDIPARLEERGFFVLDLTCPFVKRVHDKLESMEDTFPVVIIGAADHPEVIGTKGWAKGEVYIAGDAEQAWAIPRLTRALVVAQTTITAKLWQDVVAALREKSGDLVLFPSICDTTKKRQKEAEELSRQSDVMLVVGGMNSSNTRKLYRICAQNCKKTFHIDDAAQIVLENIGNDDIISIVAGASTPDWLIREVQTRMSEVDKVQEPTITDERENGQVAQANEEQARQPQESTEPEAEATKAVAEEAPGEDQQEEHADEHTDFMAEIDKSFVNIRRGQLVTGTVVQISDDEICVNIGYKSDGIIKKENLTSTGDAVPADLFQVGDEIEAEVVTMNDGEGNVVLSRKSIESKLKWKELLENLDTDKIHVVKVDKVVKGGVLAKLEGYDAFIPASQLSLKYVEDLSEFVGNDLEVSIIEADKRQRRFVLSHKAILQQKAAEEESKLYEGFHKGDKVAGKVKRLTDFGAFVDVGGIDGLLHITDISWAKVKHPSDTLKVDDEIEVMVLNVDPEKKRVSLGLKQLLPKPWDLAPEKYIVGDTASGTVVRIMPFGAFVSLEPTIDGLIHISQVTNRRLEKVEEELRIGDKITAKIMEVNPAKKRISLSIRALMDEPEKVEKVKSEHKDKDEKFHYEIPPAEAATSSLADFFPKAEEEEKPEEQ